MSNRWTSALSFVLPPPADEMSRVARFANTMALFILSIVGAWAIESWFNTHELLHEFLENGAGLPVEFLLVSAFLTLMIFLTMSSLQFRRERAWRKEAQAYALKLANHDALTGLANRRLLEAALDRLPVGAPYAVLVVDLDDFKPINDVFGHAAGDQILMEVARRLVAVCSPDDIVCRFGGDEFAIMTRECNSPLAVLELGQKLVESIKAPILLGNQEYIVGGSVGATFVREGERSGSDALREADLALYKAKETYHIGCCLFERSMEADVRRRNLMDRKLRKAIEAGIVQPFFQPLVNLETSEIIGFEALARWYDPDLGYVSPAEFIKVAEESGQITSLFVSLFRQACTEAMNWPPELKLAFNVSPRQIKDKQLGMRILSILGETGLPPRRLEIEITENTFVEDQQAAIDFLNELQTAGIMIAIDDFGTGYSSLYHLKQFHFDNLKIDRSFISGDSHTSQNAMIVDAILSLARNLGLETTAEGIESDDQLHRLVKSGCKTGQGYLFGKAVSAAEARKLTKKSNQLMPRLIA